MRRILSLVSILACLVLLGGNQPVQGQTASHTVHLPLVSNAQASNRVGLIVDFGGERRITTCVSFTEPELREVEVLRRSGLEIACKAYPGIGEAVCRIEDVGCTYPAEPCWCQCTGSPCVFWSLWYWEESQEGWVYQGMGASSRGMHDGEIIAFMWGSGDNAPPALPFDVLCTPPVQATM